MSLFVFTNSQTIVTSFKPFITKTTRPQHPNQIQFDSSPAGATQAPLPQYHGQRHSTSSQGDQLLPNHPGKRPYYLNATEPTQVFTTELNSFVPFETIFSALSPRHHDHHCNLMFLLLSRLPSLLLYPTPPLYSGVVFAWPLELTFRTALSTRHRDHHPTTRPSLPRKSRNTVSWPGSKLKTVRSPPNPTPSLPNHHYISHCRIIKEGRNLKRINLSLRAGTCQTFVVSGPRETKTV